MDRRPLAAVAVIALATAGGVAAILSAGCAAGADGFGDTGSESNTLGGKGDAASNGDATLVFAADFSERREGALVPGGEVTIAYDTDRLTTCRNSQGGQPRWDLSAHVVFAPGGQQQIVSVRDTSPAIDVPADAESITLWFENTSVSGCQAWDSNFGANYTFTTRVAPQWMGNTKNLISRGASDPCDGGTTAPFSFDDWARQRAAVTNLCFEVYEPGLTDTQAPDLWEQLDTKLHYRYVGATTSAWQSTAVNLDRFTGNNARYAFSWRGLDPLRTYHCPEVTPLELPAPDGARAQITVEYYLTVNGSELRPAPATSYVGTFTDFAANPWRSVNCAPN